MPFKLGGAPAKMAIWYQLMHIQLAVFDLVLLQQEGKCENEILWIMLFNYHSQSTDIHLN